MIISARITVLLAALTVGFPSNSQSTEQKKEAAIYKVFYAGFGEKYANIQWHEIENRSCPYTLTHARLAHLINSAQFGGQFNEVDVRAKIVRISKSAIYVDVKGNLDIDGKIYKVDQTAFHEALKKVPSKKCP